eukprot:2858788-Rhodomonas_salina.1
MPRRPVRRQARGRESRFGAGIVGDHALGRGLVMWSHRCDRSLCSDLRSSKKTEVAALMHSTAGFVGRVDVRPDDMYVVRESSCLCWHTARHQSVAALAVLDTPWQFRWWPFVLPRTDTRRRCGG